MGKIQTRSFDRTGRLIETLARVCTTMKQQLDEILSDYRLYASMISQNFYLFYNLIIQIYLAKMYLHKNKN